MRSYILEFIIGTLDDYKNDTHDGIWWFIKMRIEHIHIEEYPSLKEYCDVLNILAQCPDSEEKRKLETEIGLDILDYIY